MDIKWNLTVSEREPEKTEKLASAGADLTILQEAQKNLSPEVAEQIADELTTEAQKEKVFEGIHCVAAVDSSSFVSETLVDMYLISYKLNEDQKKAIESLGSEIKELLVLSSRGFSYAMAAPTEYVPRKYRSVFQLPSLTTVAPGSPS
ncbi:hypothetical protein CNYM01_05143 [Colletotrichum nymphaeae SA-01]|uniref:Uncharacterized protein n=1 Tax=Colletotrichum nymphaeae SA-01 TaxID=1460502 RepID=A0A135TX65_9PEZI|nr:hypothetical protein CNYM01_05143 [Colletotrichum nymphaeae SA-01]